MKVFRLNRLKDIHGNSGTGIVAVGYEFENGKVCMSWRTDLSTVVVADSISVLESLHGHEGATIVEIYDPKENGRYYKNIQAFIDGDDLKKKEPKDGKKG